MQIHRYGKLMCMHVRVLFCLAWKNSKSLRPNVHVPLHRQLPAAIRAVDSDGNLMYPIINDALPMDFDDVLTAERSGRTTSSLSKSASASVDQDNANPDIMLNEVLKAQIEYRAYMDSVLGQRRQKRNRK